MAKFWNKLKSKISEASSLLIDALEEEEQTNNPKTKVKINSEWRRDKKDRPYAICPKCHSRIYYLKAEEYFGKIFVDYKVAPNEKGELSCYEWFNKDNTPGKEEPYPLAKCSYLKYFKCPKCLQTIAENYEEAKALFQKTRKENTKVKK